MSRGSLCRGADSCWLVGFQLYPTCGLREYVAPPPYHLLVDWCGGVLVDFLGICWCPCHLFLFFFSLFFLVDRKARYTFFDPSSRPLPIPLGSHPLEVISFLFLIVSSYFIIYTLEVCKTSLDVLDYNVVWQSFFFTSASVSHTIACWCARARAWRLCIFGTWVVYVYDVGSLFGAVMCRNREETSNGNVMANVSHWHDLEKRKSRHYIW